MKNKIYVILFFSGMLTSCSQNSEGNDTIKTPDKSQSSKDSKENFKCSDGTTIPPGYLNDGGCDCPTTCEDENIGV
jgi:hypothetical protein